MVRIVPYICVQFRVLPHKTDSRLCSLQLATVSVLSDDVSLTSVTCNSMQVQLTEHCLRLVQVVTRF